MNDDASPSSSARDELWDDDDDVGAEASAQSQTDDRPAQQPRPRAQSEPQQRRWHPKNDVKKHCPGLRKKLAFLTHLLKTLDLVVFAELSALYYMECSMFRFLLRAFGQHFHLSPKDETFPVVMPASRVQLIFVVTPNIICMLLHLFASLPVGRDDQRGYQHGGLVIDFIGQKPSASKAYYVLADVLILVLQCVMLTIHAEREQMRVTLKTFRPLAADLAQQAVVGRTLRELDEEERGVSAMMDEEAGDEAVDVEMRLLNQGADSTTEEAGPSNSNGAHGTDSTTHLSNVMDSGNAVLGPYHVIQSYRALPRLRDTAIAGDRTVLPSLTSMNFNATLVALRANSRRRQIAESTSTPL